jgi:hypothetical protein
MQGLRGFDAAGAGNSYKMARDEAVQWLRDISAGRVKISGGNTAPTQTTGARVSTRESRGWYESASETEEDDW